MQNLLSSLCLYSPRNWPSQGVKEKVHHCEGRNSLIRCSHVTLILSSILDFISFQKPCHFTGPALNFSQINSDHLLYLYLIYKLNIQTSTSVNLNINICFTETVHSISRKGELKTSGLSSLFCPWVRTVTLSKLPWPKFSSPYLDTKINKLIFQRHQPSTASINKTLITNRL